jgi:hypothetical protein
LALNKAIYGLGSGLMMNTILTGPIYSKITPIRANMTFGSKEINLIAYSNLCYIIELHQLSHVVIK